ncbi:Lin0512 family protein [Halomonas piscis]|uniref:Lin0512 family protein n=1 Tax=Halomonas piscis TaxID=3031727 RepID=UPI00289D5EAD|nr:Lin0512 family protein [Halomonas piscis]
MAEKRLILAMGSGHAGLHEGYTQAARHAVHDALSHSSLALFQSLKLDERQARTEVTIGVQQPDSIDEQAIISELATGEVSVTVRHGGLDVQETDGSPSRLVAAAAVAVFLTT